MSESLNGTKVPINKETSNMARTDKVGSHKTSKGTNDQGQRTIRYHNTDVVAWDHKVIILKNDGFTTRTTKLRMNQASQEFGLGYRVWQKDFNWYVDYEGETLEFKGLTLELTRSLSTSDIISYYKRSKKDNEVYVDDDGQCH